MIAGFDLNLNITGGWGEGSDDSEGQCPQFCVVFFNRGIISKWFLSLFPSGAVQNRQFFSNNWLLSVLLRNVLLKVARCFAWETTLIASVRLFSSVSALVYFKMTRVSARIVALVTLERLHSWMGPHVFFKVRCQFAGVVTLCATEALFSRVCQNVSPEGTSFLA